MIGIDSPALGSVYNNACTSHSVTFEPVIWRGATTTIGASITSARDTTATIGTFPVTGSAVRHTREESLQRVLTVVRIQQQNDTSTSQIRYGQNHKRIRT